MAQVKWLIPSKRHNKPESEQVQRLTIKLDKAFIQALKEYSALEKSRSGMQISQSVVLKSLALHGSRELAKLYKHHQ